MKSRFISMLLTGLALAMMLFLGVQLSQSLRTSQDETAPTTEDAAVDPSRTIDPIIVRTVSESDNVMSFSGVGEANARMDVVKGERLLQTILIDEDGNWQAGINVDPAEAYKIEFVMTLDNDVRLRSDETVFRIPAPAVDEASSDQSPQPLIFVAAAGGPSRIIQSPFRGLPTSGALTLGSIDYDESGGVIFSGTSAANGRVRIYANDTAVGEIRVQAGGRWFFIAAATLPQGEYDIRAELTSEDGTKSQISVPFKRLSAENAEGNFDVLYEPLRWQVRRSLYGGGQQYSAVFAPADADAIITQ